MDPDAPKGSPGEMGKWTTCIENRYDCCATCDCNCLRRATATAVRRVIATKVPTRTMVQRED